MSEPMLPMILVSAKSEAAAWQIIENIMDEAPTVKSGENKGSRGADVARVWRIVNKYYEAEVRLVPGADDAPPPRRPADYVEGHVIYLAEDECDVETAERRYALGGGEAGGGGVRVVACERGVVPRALLAWGAARRVEPVPLRDHGEGEEDREPWGWQAVRAALHAHVWHYRRDEEGADSSEGECGGVEGGEGEQWAEAEVEAWGRAVGAAQGVRALSGEERLAAAEALVTQFARALGHRLDSL